MLAKRVLAFMGSVLLLALTAGPARANFLTGASATADCSSFAITVDGVDLVLSNTYTVDCSISGLASPFSPSFDFTVTSPPCTFDAGNGNYDCIETDNGTWPGAPLSGTFTLSGTCTLTSSGSTVPITFNGGNPTLTCGGTGCPATIGFWKNAAKHPFPASIQSSGLSIGGVTYTAAQLLTILKNPSTGNAVAILGRQLVGALINLAAGAQHNATADAAIADAESLLLNNSLNLLTSHVSPSSTLGGELTADGTTLDGYNGADFNTCTEGSGLNF